MVDIGQVLNKRYKVIKYIGSGGTATVYLAQDLILDRPVAVKLLRYDFSQDEKTLKRFQREAHAISLLAHPNIVSLYDVDEDLRTHYLVMEYVEGTDLKKYIQLYKPLTVTEIIQIMMQIIEAVAQAHEQNIIHRDLKTQNILIRRDKVVKITDFGIATGFAETAVTQTNTLIGSIHYLSPEQTRGQRATKQSDIYALGIILFELIMGEVPFKGDTAVSIAMKHFQSPIPSVINLATQTIPQSLENVILKATAKNPNNRYASCEDMLEDLKTCLRLDRQNEKKYIEPGTNRPSTVSTPTSSVASNRDRREQAVKSPKNVLNKKSPKKLSKRKWGFIGIGVFVSLLALFIGYNLFAQNTPVIVPDVTGKTQTEATKLISDAGLIVDNVTQEENQTVASGQVIRTTPQANSRVFKNSKVSLMVSSGYSGEVLKDYKNQEYTKIYKELVEKNIIVERKSAYSATVPAGYIISQSIPAGQKVMPNTTVTFTVSTGAITFRDYTNKSYETVKAELEAQGFKVLKKDEANANTEPSYIISQSIAANTQIDAATTPEITFVVSSGIRMPDFSEWNRQAVETHLRSLGLQATYKEVHSNTIPLNTVISQSISPNETVTSKTNIVITISLGKQQESTTTTTTRQSSTTSGN